MDLEVEESIMSSEHFPPPISARLSLLCELNLVSSLSFRQRSKLEMTSSRCGLCGAELLPATSFCRQCGSAITTESSVESSEQPTAILGKTESARTQRLNPRATSPTINASTSAPSRRTLLIGGVILLLLIGLISAIAMVRLRSHTPALTNSQLIYPGAATTLDMTNPDGSRTIQLQTSDPLDKVESWYHNNLKLTKTVRLTSSSYVLKNEKATITLAVEDNKTNILIKQKP
jgi:hypothetical protein